MGVAEPFRVIPLEPEMPRMPEAHEVELSEEEKKAASNTSAGYWAGGIGGLTVATLFESTEVATEVGIVGGMFICICVQFLVVSHSRNEAHRKKVEQQRRSLNYSHEQKLKSLQSQAKTRTKRLREIYEFAHAEPPATSRVLASASAALRKADLEFAENAYGPFWDAVEMAVKDLADFQRRIERLAKSADEYRSLLEGCSHNFPVFPVQNDAIPDPSVVVSDLQRTIRRGQTNFQFANIWEHRRTRTAIIGGFNSLQEAILGIGDQIRGTVDDLRSSLGSGLTGIIEAQATTRSVVEERILEQTEVLKTLHKGQLP